MKFLLVFHHTTKPDKIWNTIKSSLFFLKPMETVMTASYSFLLFKISNDTAQMIQVSPSTKDNRQYDSKKSRIWWKGTMYMTE